MKRSVLPDYVARCLETLRGAGHEAYPVGGCVRDLLLGRTPGDWDVTTSATPEQVTACFSHTVPTGIRQGTVTVLLEGGRVEVTTFRRDGRYTDGRRPDSVTFGAALEEDLARRDFTVNAMAIAPDGTVTDPFGGQEDLARGLIRCVGAPAARFSEDALRMFRAVRFSAQLGFQIEAETAAALRACAPLAARVSAERVRAEVEQILCAPRPALAEQLFRWGLLAGPTPDLSGLEAVENKPVYRWAALCDRMGSTALLEALKPDRKTLDLCRGALGIVARGRPGDWLPLLARHGRAICETAAAVLGDGSLAALLAEAPCYRADQLAVTGGELAALGLAGPEIGRAQRMLLDHVLSHPGENKKEPLLRLLDTRGLITDLETQS